MPRSNLSPRLGGALELAALGWQVVPLHSPDGGRCSCGDPACPKGGKHPRIRAWISRATSEPSAITEWWENWPSANVGVLAGRRSGIVALDVDPRNGGDDTLHALEREHGPLPPTVFAETGGGGHHYYFRAPNLYVATRKVADGLDMQGERGLLIAPPSLHVSGGCYEWDNPPDEMPLAEMPGWLLSRSTRRRSHRKSTDLILRGSRNSTLTSIAGAMRLTMAYPEGIEAALQAVNQERCRPPLPKQEVARIARSARPWHALPWLTSPREFFADERLGISTRAVLRAICDHANVEGVCFVTHATIMRLTGIKSPTTVSKHVALLENSGRVSVQRAFKQANVYRVNRALPALSGDVVDNPVVLSFQKLEDEVQRSAMA